MHRNFQRTVENFKCLNCCVWVIGDGYTNHCPNCLWSRHMDVNPGDRASRCGGMMSPKELRVKGTEYIILHECEKCGSVKLNKAAKNDDFHELVKISME